MGSNEEKNVFWDGSEPPLMFALCAKYNCTLEIWYEDGGNWGEDDGNGSGFGILGAIARREAGITLSASAFW